MTTALTQPHPLLVRVRDTNRVRYDYGVLMVTATTPIEPPPTPSGVLYGAWDAVGAIVDPEYGSWHVEGAAVSVIYGNWS